MALPTIEMLGIAAPTFGAVLTLAANIFQSLRDSRNNKQALADLEKHLIKNELANEKYKVFQSRFYSYFLFDLAKKCPSDNYKELIKLWDEKNIREPLWGALQKLSQTNLDGGNDLNSLESVFFDSMSKVDDADFQKKVTAEETKPFFQSAWRAFLYAAENTPPIWVNVDPTVQALWQKQLTDDHKEIKNHLVEIRQKLDDLEIKNPEPQFPIRHLPFSRNLNFTGREDYLQKLREQLMAGGPTVVNQAIAGMGGVGKTQIALEYAYRHLEDYQLVWWVGAETEASLKGDLFKLALKLDIAQPDSPPNEAIEELLDQLSRMDGWLLIFDNVEKPADVKIYLPKIGNGHVLLTSRWRNWAGTAKALEVVTFQRPESIAFIEKRLGHTDEAANALADALGDLPLALEQACAYIQNVEIDIAKYLQLFDDCCPDLLASDAPDAHQDTVAKTFALACEKVRTAMPAAAELLNLIAFFAPDEIPLGAIRAAASVLPEPLQQVAQDETQWMNLRRELLKYSLVEIEGDFLSIHRLVQAVIRDAMNDEEQKHWADVAVNVLAGVFPQESNDVRYWPIVQMLLPHALAAAKAAEEREAGLEKVGFFYNQIGLYSQARADYQSAANYYKKCIPITINVFGENSQSYYSLFNNLGKLLTDMGDLKEAKEIFERLIKNIQKSEGIANRFYAIVLNNLGVVVEDMGYLIKAKEMYEQALTIRLAEPGFDHSDMSSYLSNLGRVLLKMGDLAGAMEKLEQALEIDEMVYKPGHPEIATDLNKLGLVLQAMGDLTGAKEKFEQALKIHVKAYGLEHPDVATDLSNLGGVLRALGDLAGAKEKHERALKIRLDKLGEDHPDTATSLNNLGEVLRAMGDLAGAKEKFEQALTIRLAKLGEEHPNVATSLNNLGTVLWGMGDLAGAKENYEQALPIWEKALGKDHPNVATLLNNIAILLEQMGQLREAEPLYRRALAIRLKFLGPEHLYTKQSQESLARLLRKMGKG